MQNYKMLGLMITFCLLWAELRAGKPKIGCSEWASDEREVIENKIYACSGTIRGGGVFGPSAEKEGAQDLCGVDYHVCRHAIEAQFLGLTDEKCGAIAKTDFEFFATQETSAGLPGQQCYSNFVARKQMGTIYSGIWGCAKPQSGISLFPRVPCRVLNYMLTGNKVFWTLPDGFNPNHEAKLYSLEAKFNRVEGGVLCCGKKNNQAVACQDTGESYTPSHHCVCSGDTECENPICHNIKEIALILDQPEPGDLCEIESGSCCCSCPDCDGFVGFVDY
eukprot:20949_1